MEGTKSIWSSNLDFFYLFFVLKMCDWLFFAVYGFEVNFFSFNTAYLI